MICYTCEKYEKCNLPWKCSDTMQGCSAYHKEQTNEEWLKSMTTEKLAEWIYRAMFYKSCQKDVEDGAYLNMMTKKDYIENWLKEKHK